MFVLSVRLICVCVFSCVFVVCSNCFVCICMFIYVFDGVVCFCLYLCVCLF